MLTILLDEQLTGFIDIIRALAESDSWKSISELLEVRFVNFPGIGLRAGMSDRDLWQYCQSNGYYLLTDNRNLSGKESLEETIRLLNADECLPVLTISDRGRFANDREYADSVVESLLDKLIDAENLRGTGRLFLP